MARNTKTLNPIDVFMSGGIVVESASQEAINAAELAALKADIKAKKAKKVTFEVTLDLAILDAMRLGALRYMNDLKMKPDNAETQKAYDLAVSKAETAKKPIPTYAEFRVEWNSPIAYALVKQGKVAEAEYRFAEATKHLELVDKLIEVALNTLAK